MIPGTAYLTPILPRGGMETGLIEAVYAVYPLLKHAYGETAYLLVSASDAVKDTIVYPADRHGMQVSERMVACVMVVNHRQALAAAGYDLEVVVRVRA